MQLHVKYVVALVCTIVALSSFAPASQGQGMIPDAITVGTIQLIPNFNTVQVIVNWTGDGNADASFTVRYWRQSQSSAYADTAIAMDVDYAAHRCMNKIFWLDDGTAYVVEVTVDDPDGGGGTWTPTVTTRAPEGHGAPYGQIWVSPSGNDLNPGTSGSPYRTIAKAVSMLNHKGQQIRLKPGIYHERVELSFAGDSLNYNSIVGDGDPDSVIIDGSDTTLANTSWTSCGTHDIWKTHYQPAAFETIYVAVAGWGQRLFRKDSVTDLISVPSHQPDQGWFFDAAHESLYVRLESGADPNATTMHFGVRDGLVIWSPFWRAESLTVRFSHSEGIRLGGYDSQYARGAVVRNCRVYNNWYPGIRVNRGTGYVLIEDNLVWDGRIDSWEYLACKGRFEESSAGISLSNAWSGNVVRRNRVTGTFDGIQMVGHLSMSDAANTDMNNNRVLYVCDDGFEIDETNAWWFAMWGNEVRRANYAISVAPLLKGPAYVMYNVVWDSDYGGFKQGDGGIASSNGLVYAVHNTFYGNGQFTSSWSVHGVYGHRTFYNNILTCRGTNFYPIIDDAPGRGDAATCYFDYDLLYNYSGGGVFSWGGTAYATIADLRSAKGWEVHGAVGQPAFTDTTAGNFRPTSTSPSIDIGTRVMGINTPHLTLGGSAMYSGYPDAGAYDYNSTAPPAPSSRIRGIALASLSFSVSAPRPNPSSGGMTFVLTLGAGQVVESSVYDVAGRLVRRVIPRQWLAAGDHEFVWDGRDENGASVGSGLFLMRAATPNKTVVQRVVRVR